MYLRETQLKRKKIELLYVMTAWQRELKNNWGGGDTTLTSDI